MRTALFALITAALLPVGLNSQQRPLGTVDTLRTLQTGNAELLKRQQATLERLDALQKDADQVRIFAKRG